MAKKYPTARLGFSAYFQLKTIPKGITLHPMLVPYLAANWTLPSGKYEPNEMMKGWSAFSKNMGTHQYI